MADTLHLPEHPTLANFQDYVTEMVQVRGFDNRDIAATFLRFSEECGELAKAIRKQKGLSIDPNSDQYAVKEELADIFIYLLDICNYYQVDLEEAFRAKEDVNKQRTWSPA